MLRDRRDAYIVSERYPLCGPFVGLAKERAMIYLGGVGVDALHFAIVAIYCGLLAVVLLAYPGFRAGDGWVRAAM